ncbi:uncharacterized protein RJT21DRAFT_119171 [Scheffersomyces amazonensis]|uniref:uncharacterized protein n=1 Tax=Scheffersomyces amazonensis TaxID=1078765 RepID=UPI00315CBA9A
MYVRPCTRSLRRFTGKHFYSVSSILAEISSADLYASNTKVNSHKRVSHDGFEPSFYSRSTVSFDSQFTDRQGLGNSKHILQLLKEDSQFEKVILERSQPIQTFIGNQFPLSFMERLSIMCGLSNFNIELVDNPTSTSKSNEVPPNLKILYETDKLRVYGKSLISLTMRLETVFVNELYLSSSLPDLSQDLALFSNTDKIIIEFMKRNQLYSPIIPFKGATTLFDGRVEPEVIEEYRNKFIDATSIGSFYTMVGILVQKFGKEIIMNRLISSKIINGRLGLIQLAVEFYDQKKSQ